MIGLEFLTYCSGCGVLFISIAVAYRLISGKQHSKPTKKWESIPDPASDDLNDRLRAFQEARFASPIVRRTLGTDAGPRIKQRSFTKK